MTQTIAKLNIHVGSTTAEVIKGFQVAEASVSSFAAKISGFAATFAGLFGVGSVAGLVGWGAKLAADAEQSKVAFGVLTGSAKTAKTVLADMKKLADTTPFEFPEVRQAGQQLLAYGVQARDVVGTMRMLGDVSSGLRIPLGELADIYGRNLVQGRLYTKDIREFTGRGIPLVQTLTKELKVNAEQFMKMVEDGKIGSREMVRAFELMTKEGGMFHDMMDKQSKTLAGRWSTLKDSVSSLALSIGETLLPTMKLLVETGFQVVEWAKSFNVETVKNVVKIGVFVATLIFALSIFPKIIRGIMAIVQALRTMASAQAVMQAMSGPAGWATLAVSLTVAAAAAYGVSRMFDGMDKSLTKAADKADKMAQQAKKLGEAQKEVAKGLEGVANWNGQFVDSLGMVFDQFGNGQAGVRSYIEKQQEAFAKAKEVSDSLASSHVGAATRFTTQGFSAVMNGLSENRRQGEMQEKALKAQQDLLAQQKKTNEHLQKMRDNPQLKLTEVRL